MLQLHVNFRQTRWRSPHPTQCPLSPESRSGEAGADDGTAPGESLCCQRGNHPSVEGNEREPKPLGPCPPPPT